MAKDTAQQVAAVHFEKALRRADHGNGSVKDEDEELAVPLQRSCRVCEPMLCDDSDVEFILPRLPPQAKSAFRTYPFVSIREGMLAKWRSEFGCYRKSRRYSIAQDKERWTKKRELLMLKDEDDCGGAVGVGYSVEAVGDGSIRSAGRRGQAKE